MKVKGRKEYRGRGKAETEKEGEEERSEKLKTIKKNREKGRKVYSGGRGRGKTRSG